MSAKKYDYTQSQVAAIGHYLTMRLAEAEKALGKVARMATTERGGQEWTRRQLAYWSNVHGYLKRCLHLINVIGATAPEVREGVASADG